MMLFGLTGIMWRWRSYRHLRGSEEGISRDFYLGAGYLGGRLESGIDLLRS